MFQIEVAGSFIGKYGLTTIEMNVKPLYLTLCIYSYDF